MMSFALFESIFVMFLLVLAGVLFPPAWFRIGFGYKASIAVITGAVEMIRFQDVMKNDFPSWSTIWMHFGIKLVVLIILIFVFHYIEPLQRAMLFVVDQFLVFPFIYLPLGMLSVIVVIIRNIH